ncbi:hypothetical protein FEZ51_08505 [Pediococcus stilesii]|uniref:Uncharacterized protein n=1 Tax=Pediococcus stilesii TaxID=331679 RepID=A0A5R9BSE6_9LACO|nr:hypothetical protein [Pediococcus stilesii]TLQ03636.1 hypothetical protein FEZ51_08505 [Pediococcus stilesii]
MITFLGWLISGLLFIIAIFINRLPYMMENKILQEQKTRDSHEIQIESYFKELGGKEQKDVLNEWTEVLTFLKPIEDVNLLTDLVHRTVLYGSSRTIKILSIMAQYSYKGMAKDGNENKFMIYVAFLICSLKKDFSGQDIDPLTLLKVKINDISDAEEAYIQSINEIKKELRQV